jgi:rare lipoprotein A
MASTLLLLNAVARYSPRPSAARFAANVAATRADESRPEIASALFNALAITLVVVTLLLAVSMSGCGESQPPPVTPVTNAAPPPPQIQPTPKPVEKTVKASYYGPGFSGLKTASGEPFNPNAMTAASKTLPLGSVVHVTNPKTGRSVTVRINDRGPYVKGRSLDLSKGAARKIGLTGVERVKIHKVKIPSETEAVETPAAKPHEDAVVTSNATSAATAPATASPAAASPGASPDATNASDATAHSNYDVASDPHP